MAGTDASVEPAPRPLIIDTDPSIDDAVAIMTALASPAEIELLALTTVAGNVAVELTTRNALTVLELVRRTEIPVYAGADRPLVGPLRTAEHVHGASGMDGYDLPSPMIAPAPGFAPDRIATLAMAHPPGTVTICCIAPMTNLALALEREPALAHHLREIVIMGGARSEGGNVTPCAEFNLRVDPEAGQRVLACGAPITMIPLDCTHQALTSRARLDLLRAIGTPLAEAVHHLLVFNKAFHEHRCGTDGAPLHDPLTIAYLLNPALFSGRLVNVEVEVSSDLTRGMTVIDWWGVTQRPRNVQVLTSVDADAYFALITERLARLS